MVLKQLLDSDTFKTLSEQEKQIMFTAVLMHDIEKRSTTVTEEDGRITSKGHSRKGEATARKILYQEIITPFTIRETICKLVRHHGDPLWTSDRENPAMEVIKTSLVSNNQLLSLIAHSDSMGRQCSDKAELLFKIGMFEGICKENDCFDKPFVFKSELAKFRYFNGHSTWPQHEPFDDTKFEVMMMSGLPGAGKSHYIKKNLSNLPVVSLDEIRKELKIKPDDKKGNGTVVQLAKERAKEFMRKKNSFVWDATNITRQMRTQLIDLFVTYGGNVRIVYVEVPYQILLKQNLERDKAVPERVLERFADKLEVPDVTEAHSVEYVVK